MSQMFKKIYAQVLDYETTLTKQDFDSDPIKIQKEIDKIKTDFTIGEIIAKNITFENKKYTLDDFVKHLKQQKNDLEEKKSIKKEYDSFLFHNIGGKNVDVSTQEGKDQIKRELATIEKQIQIQEETLAQIDNYVINLLTGEMSQLNIAHTSAKFIKIAEISLQEEVLEPVEEYFDKLYDESEGSPNYGKIMTHPEKHRNELSTEAQTSVARFKKK